MKAQQAPESPGQASLELPRQCALTSAHWKKRQPNTMKANSSKEESTPIAGVGNQVRRQRTGAVSAGIGTGRGSINVWRTKRGGFIYRPSFLSRRRFARLAARAMARLMVAYSKTTSAIASSAWLVWLSTVPPTICMMSG